MTFGSQAETFCAKPDLAPGAAGRFIVAALHINHRSSQGVLKLAQTHASLGCITLLDCPSKI